MTTRREGLPASPGIAIGPARVVRWATPRLAPGGNIAPGEVGLEIERFRAACDGARDRTEQLIRSAAARLGRVEAQIFEPQLLMLQDSGLVAGTEAIIRRELLPAERAWEWRILEWQAQWSHSGHQMLLDKLGDLTDVHDRVLRHLLDLPEGELDGADADPVIIVAHELTPSAVLRLDRNQVAGLALDTGTRTSHAAILARSQEMPAVVSLGDLSSVVKDGQWLILDGRTGVLVLDPSPADIAAYRERDFRAREWEQELLLQVHLPAVTRDGTTLTLRANIDLPAEADSARAHGAEGVGLFRTEFLAIGRTVMPGEEEQYQAFRQVLQTFPDHPVVIRTYDLGGDKFPAFLHMPTEENPYLGWRAIRVCLDEPELFRAQLRALLRAAAHGTLRVMLPLVNEVEEVRRTRALLGECAAELATEGVPFASAFKLGAMIETPAAALSAAVLAPHVDFFSIGTNDLVQYTLAVDRGNSRLAGLYKPFHPSVLRLLAITVEAARTAGIEVTLCGELASTPLGSYLALGLGIDALSVGIPALAEIKTLIRSVDRAESVRAVGSALRASTPEEVVVVLSASLGRMVDLSLFSEPESVTLGLSGAP